MKVEEGVGGVGYLCSGSSIYGLSAIYQQHYSWNFHKAGFLWLNRHTVRDGSPAPYSTALAKKSINIQWRGPGWEQGVIG